MNTKKQQIYGEKMRHQIFNLVIFLFVVLFSNSIFSQTIIDVPSVIDGDPLGALNKTILGDTTASGERAHPDAIYRLARNTVYLIDAPITINFNFTLIAADDDGTRPPMLARGVDAEGVALKKYFLFKGDSLNIKIKGIIFQGVKLDQDAYDKMGALYFYGDYGKYTIDNCIFNGIGTSNLHVKNTNNAVMIITNCIFSNGLRSNRPWSGYVASFRSNADTLIMRNNTYFNGGGYIFMNLKNLFKYAEFDHNTVYMNSISGTWMPFLTNAKFTNNLIYGDLFIGQFKNEWEGGWHGPGGKHGIITLTELDSLSIVTSGLTEADRKIDVSNNVYAWPQEFKDWYATVDSAGGLEQELWMNDIADSMFNDAVHYPNLTAENNIEADPGFIKTEMHTEVVSTALAFSKGFREFGAALENGADRYYPLAGNRFDLPWPLAENLAYSNSVLLTHAEGNFPVGDLNWFPEKKAEWEEWLATGVEKDNKGGSIPSEYTLSQNYPNPFNPSTNIKFSIPENGLVSLKVYNVLGEEVTELINKELTTGTYTVNFNASKLTSGIYFYTLSSGNFVQTKKMLLIK